MSAAGREERILDEVTVDQPRSPVPARAWRALAVGSLGFSLMSFNTTATNLAFGDISADFAGTSAAALSWVASIFFIGMASLLLVAGRLADRIGRRRMFRAGLVTFAVGSALSAVAPGVYVLIAARLVTAAGGAMILPSSLAVVLPEFPKDRHFSAIAFWSATGPLASALAPGLSALILAASGWRVLFLLSTPVALVALAGTFGSLAESKATATAGSLDLVGVVVGTAAIACLVFGASFGSDQGWTSGVIIGAFLAAAVLLPVFVQRCRTHPQPLLNLKVFTLPAVTVANIANFLLNFAGLATWLVWPLFLARVWGYSKLETGLALLPGPIISGFVTALGGRLSERFGHERIVRYGAFIATMAVVWPLFFLREEPNYLAVGPALGLFGMGWSLTHPPLNSGVVNRVGADLYGEVNASFNTVRNIAGALGIAVAVTIIGKETGPEPLTVYRSVFAVFAISVALCWAVLALVYPRVSSLRADLAD
ncbi:MAG: MFS transporter [Acidimicrobiales bacterium]|nr:MFS transporter [Acidimicrobiales bacterium]